jgi:hypothetical protein
MRNILRDRTRNQFVVGLVRSTIVVFVALGLGVAFWMVSAPVATAREITPTEMIQSKLPATKTLMTASKPEVLSAVCGAVRKWRKDAAQIVRTAAGARRELAPAIVAEAIRCLREHLDCTLVGQIVAAGLAVDPDQSATIMEQALQLAPDCRAQIEQAGGRTEGEGDFSNNLPGEINLPPGSTGGGAGQNTCLVCHDPSNPREIQVPCEQVDQFIQSHPGDFRGPCQATQVQNP